MVCLAVLLSFGGRGQQQAAEPFDLEVTLITASNPDFTMQTTVRAGQAFEMTATNGAVTNKVSGTLHPPANGEYPLDLTVSEWASESAKSNYSLTLNLTLGKTWGGGMVSSFADMYYVTLRRHESRLQPKANGGRTR
jgi:hypothetical protein